MEYPEYYWSLTKGDLVFNSPGGIIKFIFPLYTEFQCEGLCLLRGYEAGEAMPCCTETMLLVQEEESDSDSDMDY